MTVVVLGMKPVPFGPSVMLKKKALLSIFVWVATAPWAIAVELVAKMLFMIFTVSASRDTAMPFWKKVLLMIAVEGAFCVRIAVPAVPTSNTLFVIFTTELFETLIPMEALVMVKC